jgi:hypothetical protein
MSANKNSVIQIPENFTEFLYWVKETTETSWAKAPDASADDFNEQQALHGAKWIGLSEPAIDEIERHHAIRFSNDHREFLRILHTIDRRYVIPFEVNGEVISVEQPFFYNWLEDGHTIAEMLQWPYKTISDDILGENGLWLESWGRRPASDEKKIRIFSQWLKEAPKLFPLISHSFLVNHSGAGWPPVLSVWGSDIVVLGWNLRHYLLREFAGELGLLEQVYNEEDQCYYSQFKRGIGEIDRLENIRLQDTVIPVWKEMILYKSIGWTSFRPE